MTERRERPGNIDHELSTIHAVWLARVANGIADDDRSMARTGPCTPRPSSLAPFRSLALCLLPASSRISASLPPLLSSAPLATHPAAAAARQNLYHLATDSYEDPWGWYNAASAQGARAAKQALDPGTCFDRVVFPMAPGDSPLWAYFWEVHDCHDVAFFQRFVRWLRASFGIEPVPKDKASKPHVVFVSRKDVGTRVIGPEDELVEWLKRGGVSATAAKMGDMPLREQVRVSSEATVLVATNGAGMVHQLWQPDEAVIIEARAGAAPGEPREALPFLRREGGAAWCPGPACGSQW